MSIDQHVPVTVSVNNAGIAREGFGTSGILSYKQGPFAGARSLTFTRLADAITAGFPADSPEGLSVARILGQSPHPISVKLLRGTLPPTQRFTLNISSVRNSFAYRINVKGEGVTPTAVSFTSDASATDAEIVAGLVTALNAVTGKNYTAAGASSPFTVTGSAAGNWFSLEVLDTSAISIIQDHADPGIATDLAAIYLLDPTWYYLDTSFNSTAMTLAAAAWIEATPFKAYVVDLVNSDIENTAAPGSDIAAQLKALGYKRTLYSYHRKPNEKMSAAWEGRVSPLNVGTWDAAYKNLTGVTADEFTATQVVNIEAKKASYYKAEAGRSFTWNGAIANTDFNFFDNTVSLDFVVDDIQKSVMGARLALNKVAYTDDDIQGVIKGAVEGAVDRAKSESNKIIALGTPGDPDDPEPIVSFPLVKDINPSLRALRQLPPGNVTFRLQGAVNIVPISLTVTF